jgi:regulator of RNase E activity RraA
LFANGVAGEAVGPVRIGGVTVMPGDLVAGDREGVYFIPPQFTQAVLDHADETHIHDEWVNRTSIREIQAFRDLWLTQAS